MKKYLIVLITILTLITTSCQAKNKTNIYIGEMVTGISTMKKLVLTVLVQMVKVHMN